MMLIDTHTHLDLPEFAEDLDHVLLRAKQSSVERIITIGTTLQSSRKAIQLAERYPQIYASVVGFIRIGPVKSARISSLSWRK
jgi:TatD DNase family protein